MAQQSQPISYESPIFELLSKFADGLDVTQIEENLPKGVGLSGRTLRNLLNDMTLSKQLYRRRAASSKGAGAPPWIYQHPDFTPRQMTMFDNAKFEVEDRGTIERDEMDAGEKERLNKSLTVLERIAHEHVSQESLTQRVIKIAPQVAEKNPIQLLCDYAEWIVNDYNALVREWRKAVGNDNAKANQFFVKLEARETWCKQYFYGIWRFNVVDSSDTPILGVFQRSYPEIHFDRARAEQHLVNRLTGQRIIELKVDLPDAPHSCVGTDGSVADLFLEHSGGKFLRQDPIAVLNAAASKHVQAVDGHNEYQDFDIFPEGLREYEAYAAAKNGLVISPALREVLPESDFKHSRSAAMELRQYEQDFRVVSGQARWRPIGDAIPSSGMGDIPPLIIRDGRLLPLVHRVRDFESDGLYGQIVRNQIRSFAKVIHQVHGGPYGNIAYASTVKNPQQSWLSPLIFWYIYQNSVDKDKLDRDMCYNSPFTDTAVSHLLFLGYLKTCQAEELADTVITTCQAKRHFSDVAFSNEGLPMVIESDLKRRPVHEDDIADWRRFFDQRIKRTSAERRSLELELRDYEPFIYLCANVEVAMFYAAPAFAYRPLAFESGEGHFLLARLEVSGHKRFPQIFEEAFNTLLSWYKAGKFAFDSAHQQDNVAVGDAQGIPILVPDVIVSAHEAVTFGRDYIGDEVDSEIRQLISELRRGLKLN